MTTPFFSIGDMVHVIYPDDRSKGRGYQKGDFAVVTHIIGHTREPSKIAYNLRPMRKGAEYTDAIWGQELEMHAKRPPQVGDRIRVVDPDEESVETEINVGECGKITVIEPGSAALIYRIEFDNEDLAPEDGDQRGLYEAEFVVINGKEVSMVGKPEAKDNTQNLHKDAGKRIRVVKPVGAAGQYEVGDTGVLIGPSHDSPLMLNQVKLDKNGKEVSMGDVEYEVIPTEATPTLNEGDPIGEWKGNIGDMIKIVVHAPTDGLIKGDLARIIAKRESGTVQVEWIVNSSDVPRKVLAPSRYEVVK